jgi:hypothetical protein
MTTEEDFDFDFEWDEFKLIIADKEDSDEEPCISCIGRVMCIHKTWMQVLDSCHIVEKYIGTKAKKQDSLYDITGVMVDIRSIDKRFAVHATKGKDILLIGKYWEVPVDKGGYPEMGVDMKNFKMYTLKSEEPQ